MRLSKRAASKGSWGFCSQQVCCSACVLRLPPYSWSAALCQPVLSFFLSVGSKLRSCQYLAHFECITVGWLCRVSLRGVLHCYSSNTCLVAVAYPAAVGHLSNGYVSFLVCLMQPVSHLTGAPCAPHVFAHCIVQHPMFCSVCSSRPWSHFGCAALCAAVWAVAIFAWVLGMNAVLLRNSRQWWDC